MRNMSDAPQPLAASFRDPSGQLFTRDGVLYRQVNESYREEYDQLMGSGLYGDLVRSGMLISHREVHDIAGPSPGRAYITIQPEAVSFISYPYEWCFGQLKDAALLTLALQKKALSYGMSLKDASAYNVQFVNGKPVFIDTLSFEKYREGIPWVAYRQFCQHFLAPLALMSFADVRLGQLLRANIDGIPLDLASLLLPRKTYLRFSLLSHIHLHAKTQERFAKKKTAVKGKMSRFSLQGLIDNLEAAVKKLDYQPSSAVWADYYEETVFSGDYLEQKKKLIDSYLEQVKPGRVWDLGANTGLFSRLASRKGIDTISMDVDPACVERNYRELTQKGEGNLLPLVVDLTNPSPGMGWNHEERMSFLERGPADLILALALLHHLVISNNLPFSKVAEFFARSAKALILEYIPKDDPRAKDLLANREDVFAGEYTQENFEKEFAGRFALQEKAEVGNSGRILYLMTINQQ